ncbi:hypothetical protein QRQ56_25250 [Bradyrhizobium sp. U531]|uniref:hypothetical protein n=1 Tax=Bradyrhizobium sp. U531 TaxID=3053458 RepID=UPI003F41FC81
MPTYYKPQLTETSTPFREVWEFMRRGLDPVARQILGKLEFYEERGIQAAAPEEPLSEEEKEELGQVITALTIAAVRSEEIKPGSLVSTLARLHKEPELFCNDALPAMVVWELAQDYQRDSEPPGTFSMDIWGSDQTAVSYKRLAPSNDAIALAAGRARARIQRMRSPGRPDHPAHPELGRRLAPIFATNRQGSAGSPHPIMGKGRVPFIDFLEMVLPPLRKFLSERRLLPVNKDAIVEAAHAFIKDSWAAHPLCTPDYSNGLDIDSPV